MKVLMFICGAAVAMLVSAGESRTKTVTLDPAAPDIRSHGSARAVPLRD